MFVLQHFIVILIQAIGMHLLGFFHPYIPEVLHDMNQNINGDKQNICFKITVLIQIKHWSRCIHKLLVLLILFLISCKYFPNHCSPLHIWSCSYNCWLFYFVEHFEVSLPEIYWVYLEAYRGMFGEKKAEFHGIIE